MSAADDLARARAFLVEQPKLDESLTDDQRAILNRRRKVLGSLDDTYALNRSERGSADMLAVVFCAVAFLLVELSFAHARFAVAALAVIGLWVTVAVPVAVVIGRGMGGRR